MYDELQGKVAIITGTGREKGIGRGIAVRLAGEGVHAVLGDICRKYEEFPDYLMGTWEGLQETAELVRSKGVHALPLKVDVTRSQEVSRMIEAALEEFVRIDILVNNAGAYPGMSWVAEMTEAAWNKTLAVNITGTFLCSRAAMPHLPAGGRIINIASIAGKEGLQGYGPYDASKGGVVLFTQTLAKELGPRGINVNAICPGLIDTLLTRKGSWAKMQAELGLSEEEVLERLRAETALGRLGTTDDIAKVAAFLASEQASYITGQAINVDGGIIFH